MRHKRRYGKSGRLGQRRRSAGVAVSQHAGPTLQLLDHELELRHHFRVEDTQPEQAYPLSFVAKLRGGWRRGEAADALFRDMVCPC